MPYEIYLELLKRSNFEISKNTPELHTFISGNTVNFRVCLKQKMPENH